VKKKIKQEQEKDEEKNKKSTWNIPLSDKPQRC
jgi:hypothetical protein